MYYSISCLWHTICHYLLKLYCDCHARLRLLRDIFMTFYTVILMKYNAMTL